MQEIMVIGHAHSDPAKPELAMEVFRQYQTILSELDGFRSMTCWQAVEDPTEFRVVRHYRDEASAEAGEAALIESDAFELVMEAFIDTADVRRYMIDGRSSPNTMPVGAYASFSVTQSPAGEETEVEQDLSLIFENLKAIPGYRGGMFGRNVSLTSEVLGLAFWDSIDAFVKSLPEKPVFVVKAFRRVA
ncbi:MAG: antibiotic biosynthesis monooxygenase [Armatimonadetes bacterium]|nr:antibiotic biosynthesis monooxygenase [Armatimonadota bacterium]